MIYLPDAVRENVEREQMVDRHLSMAREFNRRLQAIYPDMYVVLAGERAFAPGIRPGRWHVVQPGLNGGPDLYMPIVGPDGGYQELNDATLNWLRQRDLHRPGALQELIDREEKRLAKAEALKEEAREARFDELVGRHKALTNPGVSFSDSPWTYRKGRS